MASTESWIVVVPGYTRGLVSVTRILRGNISAVSTTVFLINCDGVMAL